MLTITRNLNVYSSGIPQIINLSQYDSDFQLVFNLYTSQGTLTIPSGTTAEIQGTKKSGTGYSAAAALAGNTVTVTGDNQMTACAGANVFEISLKNNGKVLNTVNFILVVERAALDGDTIQDETVLKELQAIIDSVEDAEQAVTDARDAAIRAENAARTLTIDSTLTQSGQAADAKATGDRIDAVEESVDDVKEEIEKIATFTEYANLFDKSSVVPNKTLTAGSGQTYNSLSDSDILSVSPIIPVEGGNSYTGSGKLMGNSARVFYYNENGAYLGGNDGVLNADGSYTYNFVEVVKYVRFRYTTALLNIDEYMFVKGTALPSEYTPYGKYLSDGELLNVKNELSSEIDAVNDKIDSVDDQLNIRSVLYKVPNTIDGNGFTNGAFINGNTGEMISQSAQTTFWCSDYTEIVGGVSYYAHDIYMPGHMAFYDADKNYISGYETTIPNPFPTPLNAKYVRFLVISSTITKAKNVWLNIIDEAPEETEVKYTFDKNTILAVDVENPCDYNGNEITIFNKIMCIGDSITAGTFNHNEGGTMAYMVDEKYSYPTFLKKLCGVETLNNGIGGYTSVQWWNARQNADFSGYDCAIINLGINDALQNVSVSDTTTALENIINALKTANEGTKIFLATVVPAYSDGTTQFDAVNETIRNVASHNNCYLIDLSVYSHARKGTVSEAGHLTAWGYYRLAKDYISAISYIMNENRTAFKFVQFIGTDYAYNA